MISRIKPNLRRICRSILYFLLAVSSINCIIWDLVGYNISLEVYSLTYTAISLEQTEFQREIEEDIARETEWADYNNAYATNQAATYQAILAAPTTTPPTILSIEFPSEIPGDGTTYHGKLYFQDAEGDVVRLTIEVISAINFGSADYDPRAYLISGDPRQGAYDLYIWCEGQQDVVLQTRLQDYAGYWSNPHSFKFTCT